MVISEKARIPLLTFFLSFIPKMGFREDTQKLADKFGNGGAEGGALTERDDLDDEKPVVVVVHDGDLSEGEAKEIEDRLGPKNKEDEEDDEGDFRQLCNIAHNCTQLI